MKKSAEEGENIKFTRFD